MANTSSARTRRPIEERDESYYTCTTDVIRSPGTPWIYPRGTLSQREIDFLKGVAE